MTEGETSETIPSTLSIISTDIPSVLGSLYVYAPNKGAPIFFTVAYAISAAGHVWQCHHYKSWRLIGLHPLCAVLFTTGYALRIYGAYGNYIYIDDDPKNLLVFILSQVFIYACPPLLELANYHVLGRILHYVPHLAPIPANRVLSIFGGLMVIVETLNGLGVSLATNPSSSTQDQGSHLVLAATALQLVLIAIFTALASIFHRRCYKANMRTSVVMTPLKTLYASMALIFARCVYRLVEHLGLTEVDLDDAAAPRRLSPLLGYEVFFLVFESTLMLLNSILWSIWNPCRYLPRKYEVHLTWDGSEVEGEEESD